MKKILIIEDNEDVIMIMKYFLRKIDIEPIAKLTGHDALNFIFGKRKYKNRDKYPSPDLILLDLTLPDIDGIEVLRQIKTTSSTKEIPTYIFTSSKNPQDAKKCTKLGANGYIVKDFSSFLDTVKSII